MNPTQSLWLTLASIWALVEITIVIKTRTDNEAKPAAFRSAKWIWWAIGGALLMALAFKRWHLAPIPMDYLPRQFLALQLFSLGLGLRFYAIASLGQFFTTTAMVQDQHKLIVEGPYQLIRHPAYSGLIISFIAAGLAMGDGLALLSLCCPLVYVLAKRIQYEESLLVGYFGQVYDDYCQRTKKLIPWLY
jgi:protein-S-isoprenylcysteine O-methyltransferase Ste14